MVTKETIWKLLEDVFDPEVPVLTILDLGIVRNVELLDDVWKVTITPTYSGCPAMQRIESDIIEVFSKENIDNVEVDLVLTPAWTTDWLSEDGKRKLKEYGIAPPVAEMDKSVLFAAQPIVPCPLCNSENTKMVSQFGSTACKAHYQCRECQEPFDYFKCLK